jgi:hypothetical protein
VRRLLILVALAPILMADTCGDQNACNQVPPGIGGTVVTAQAATDPCAGQPPLHVVAWYAQGGVRYPLRCGRRDPRGYGYLHIRYDERGHGDPANDPTFSAEIATTLARGVEGFEGGANYRYTLKYDDAKSMCLKGAWGFRVVLAKAPPLPDGRPTGIITALYYTETPAKYP